MLVKELKNFEAFNARLQEDKIINLILKARKMQRVKRMPPPLAPLPAHLIPKRIIDELGVDAPMVADYDDGRGKLEDRLNDTRTNRRISLMMDHKIEVFDKDVDPFNEADVKLKKVGGDKALFLGVGINEDAVTKLLTTKDDLIKMKQQRQVLFNEDGPIDFVDEE